MTLVLELSGDAAGNEPPPSAAPIAAAPPTSAPRLQPHVLIGLKNMTCYFVIKIIRSLKMYRHM